MNVNYNQYFSKVLEDRSTDVRAFVGRGSAKAMMGDLKGVNDFCVHSTPFFASILLCRNPKGNSF